jgi:hypothetical protein
MFIAPCRKVIPYYTVYSSHGEHPKGSSWPDSTSLNIAPHFREQMGSGEGVHGLGHSPSIGGGPPCGGWGTRTLFLLFTRHTRDDLSYTPTVPLASAAHGSRGQSVTRRTGRYTVVHGV